jgi:hypothetical protein
MTKISIVSMNLSTNCTARCLVLAEALAPRYEVELVGSTFGYGGKELWPPIKDIDFPIRAVTGDLLPGYLPHIRSLLRMIDGDVIIACKPRFPSLGVALMKRAMSGTPVILDVDDDELAQTMPGRQASLVSKLRNTTGYLFTRMVHPLHRRVDGVLCVSEFFRKRYGGVIVPHGRDAKVFDPARFDRQAIRRQLGFSDDDLVVGFIGTAQRQKGTDLVVTAAEKANNPHIRVMVAGAAAAGDEYTDELRRRFGDRIVLLPTFPLLKVPELHVAADVIVLPQRSVPESYGQMPAKLTDAMAMGKIIIASTMSDIPKYLDGCGLLVPPDDEAAITKKLIWIGKNRAAAEALGRMARARFLKDMTYESMREAMTPTIETLLRNRRYRTSIDNGGAVSRRHAE